MKSAFRRCSARGFVYSVLTQSVVVWRLGCRYAPEFYVDDLAMTRSHLEPLSTNQSASDPRLQIEFYPSSRQHVQSLKTIEMALAA